MHNSFDVSLVLALHREAGVLRRTLLSLREAAYHARAAGLTIELVATLDRTDEVTRQVLRDFGSDGFDGWTVVDVDHGSLGPSRNSGIEAARGRYISTCDGDDLISCNSISVMLNLAESAGDGNIIFPQYLYAFGDHYHCWKYFPLDIVTPLAFLDTHPYISRAFAHRSVFEAIPYADTHLSSGYAYEDWHFNAECVAHGYRMLVAEDTILFYRQRAGSLVSQSNNRSTRQIPPCTLFEPETWVRITRDAYDRLAPFDGALPDVHGAIGWDSMLDSDRHRAFIRAANAIEPTVEPGLLKAGIFGNNLSGVGVAAGLAYHEVCQIIGAQRFDEVFLMPFIAKGGAERYINDVMRALYEIRPIKRILVLLGQSLPGGSYIDRVPPNATVLELGNDWPHLALEQRQLLALKVVQSVASRARIHIVPSPFAMGFYDKFKTILHLNSTVFYRFCDAMILDAGCPFVQPWSFSFLSEHVLHLALIVADNQTIIELDRERIGVCFEKWRCLPARQAPSLTEDETMRQAAARKGRVLWASRLDRQKRPEILHRIAEELGRTAADVRIDVFGSAVLDTFDPASLADLANLDYRGPFDGLASIDCSAYDAFVYTSGFDGMPNVVLEAVAAGLPVIAPDVGGIGEVIVDGETGLLLPPLPEDQEMASAYARAITRITDDAALRVKLAKAARRLLVKRHAPPDFAANARRIFGGAPTRAAAQSDTNLVTEQ